MKFSSVLLAGSLTANAVLLGVVAVKMGLPTARRSDSAAAIEGNARVGNAPGGGSETTSPRLWPSLDAADLPTLIAHLRVAGFPTNTVLAIAQTRIDAVLAVRAREIVGARPRRHYWEYSPFWSGPEADYYEAVRQLHRDRTTMMTEAYAMAEDFLADPASAGRESDRPRSSGELPREKEAAVQRIAADYEAMRSQVQAATAGIMLPGDKEKLALLEREMRADLAATLTPQELADCEMRTSVVTAKLRRALTLMDATEAEFRAIYAAQQPVRDELYANVSARTMGSRLAAEAAIEPALKAALGEQRYADFIRSSSHEFQELDRIARQENVSREAALRAFALRDGVANESNRIFDDPTMAVEQKRAALRALAEDTKARLSAMLGATAGDAYVKEAGWVSNIERGRAVKLKLNGSSVRGLPDPEEKKP